MIVSLEHDAERRVRHRCRKVLAYPVADALAVRCRHNTSALVKRATADTDSRPAQKVTEILVLYLRIT